MKGIKASEIFFGGNVQIAGFEKIFCLMPGSGGKIVSGSNGLELKGRFYLQFAGPRGAKDSTPLEFGYSPVLQCLVKKMGGEYFLDELDETFSFVTTKEKAITVQPNEDGPILYIPRVAVKKLRSESREASFLAIDPLISLLSDDVFNPTEPNRFAYTAGPGPKTRDYETLLPLVKNGEKGYPISREKDHLLVSFGGLKKRVSIKIGGAPQLVVPSSLPLGFKIPLSKSKGIGGPLVFDTAADEGDCFEIVLNPDHALKALGSCKELASIKAKKVEFKSGWVVVQDFFEENLSLLLVPQNQKAGGLGDSTSIFSPQSHFCFYMALPDTTGNFGPRNRAEFSYFNEKAIVPDAPADTFGLRIRSLPSVKGGLARFDTDKLSVYLNGRTFQFIAGKSFRYDPFKAEVESILAPKFVLVDDGDRLRLARIPADAVFLCVECGRDFGREGDPSPLSLDTALVNKDKTTGLIEFHQDYLRIEGPPLNSSASKTSASLGKGAASLSYKDWNLKSEKPLDLKLNKEGNWEPESKWLDKFRTLEAQNFALLDNTGARLLYNGPSHSSKSPRGENSESTSLTVFEASGKEIVGYSAFFAAVSYYFFEFSAGENEGAVKYNRIELGFKDLTAAGNAEWIKANSKDGLVLAFAVKGRLGKKADKGDIGENQWIDFILRNAPSPLPDNFDFYFPLQFNLGIPLLHREPGKNQFVWNLVPETETVRMGIDLSLVGGLSPADMGMGIQGKTWRDLEEVRNNPRIWVRAADPFSSRRDPSDGKWKGIFFRDVPLHIIIPKAVLEEIKKYQFLVKLFEIINQSLWLNYGWADEAKPSWKAALRGSETWELTPPAWNHLIRITLGAKGKPAFEIDGAAGNVIRSGGTLEMHFPVLAKPGGTEPGIIGSFDIKFDGDVRLDKITIESSEEIASRIPGFKKIRFSKIVTDFKILECSLDLVAGPELAKILPILDLDRPMSATMMVNLGEKLPQDGSFALSLVLPAEKVCKFYDKFKFTITSLVFRIPNQGATKLEIAGRFDLGMTDFFSVGGKLILTETGGSFDLAVELDQAHGSLGIGDMRAGLDLYWRDGAREFYGHLKLEKDSKGHDLLGPLAGDELSMALRVGTTDTGVAFWAAALSFKSENGLRLAKFAKLKEGMLVFAKNATPQDARTLASVAASGATSELNTLLPLPGDNDEGWLASWQVDPNGGRLLGASGKFEVHDDLLKAPKDSKPPKNTRTSFLISEAGLARIDATSSFLGVYDVQFVVIIDLVKKFIGGGIKAPQFNFPRETKQFQIDGGFLFFGIGYGEKKELQISVGWPPLTGSPGSDGERDWSQAVMVHWEDCWPINTFWGGYRSRIAEENSRVEFGFAIRAGWVKRFSVGGGVIEGTAELGVAVGGVVQFFAEFSGYSSISNDDPRNVAVYKGLDDCRSLRSKRGEIETALSIIEEELRQMVEFKTGVEIELYADVWGTASVRFFGITLAGASIHGYARFAAGADYVSGKFTLYRLTARIGFTLSVKVLCVHYSASGFIDVFLKRGDPSKFTMSRRSPSRLKGENRLLPAD